MHETAPSRTAEFVCLFRALERRRPVDARIVDDPYAEHFLGPALQTVLRATQTAKPVAGLSRFFFPGGLVPFVLARHRFIDDTLAAALARSGPARVEQVVILGAGYDTRAWRFAHLLDGRPVYEVDYPSTSRRKARLARQHGRELPAVLVRRVEVDFLRETFDGPLLGAGFRRGARTFFVWEGVSMYLTRAAVKQTLGLVRDLGGPGSDLCCDFWFLLDAPDLRAAAHRLSASLLHLLGEPVLFGIHPEDLPPFLGALGFDVVETNLGRDLARRFVHDGRDVYEAMVVTHATSRGAPTVTGVERAA